MSDEARISIPADAPEISGARLVDAPRALVFDAFFSADRLARWFGPKGFSLTTRAFEFASGGVWRFVMHGPDGRDYENRIVFREIMRPERISYIHAGDDVDVEPVRMETIIVLSQEGEKTRVDWRMRFPSLAERDRVERDYGAAIGLEENLGRLGDFVEASAGSAFVTSRRFSASRELLWKALTEPERMAQWFGPKGVPAVAAQMDFRPGGSYHYGLRTPDGGAMWGLFEYLEIEPPARIVLLASFSDAMRGLTRHPLSGTWPLKVETTYLFAETDGGSELTCLARRPSKRARKRSRPSPARSAPSTMAGPEHSNSSRAISRESCFTETRKDSRLLF
ncbi:SRPBCC family protein [Methylosinus sp. Ce-a6]|uniref:SRPBCC family protein n=1 Tax=Methylosinus sp. Ce-a6 TaxID=2172005 RepID=UPI00135A122A|nr:SRPBCC family protein [Methylosinus sp. Ce-a6]